jgi:hypothetical protein
MAICILCEENELAPRSILLTCRNCRASMGAWGRRPAAEVLNRRRRLHIWDLRMENVVLNPRNIRAVPVVKPFVPAKEVKLRAAKQLQKNGGAG